MAKFKKGDRVRNLKETTCIPKGATGIVDEDNSLSPWVVWNEITEYSRESDPFNTMRWSRNEEYLELITEKNTNDPLGIIGRKMKGFKFDGFKYNYLNYHLNMNKHIGNEGEIVSYMEEYDCYYCKFSDREWAYPAKLIMQHIVDTPQELTLLEKFQQGWEIRHNKSEIKAVQVIKRKEGIGYIIEWEGGGAFCYIGNESHITCTPPKERKKLYLYRSGASCGFSVTSDGWGAQDFIAEIHLEKTDGKWNVIK